MRFIAFIQADESYANFKTSTSHRLTSKKSMQMFNSASPLIFL